MIHTSTYDTPTAIYSTAGCFRLNDGSKLDVSNDFIGPTGTLVIPRLSANHRRILTTPGAVFDAVLFQYNGSSMCSVVETFEFTISLECSDLSETDNAPAEFLLVFKRSDQKVMPRKPYGAAGAFLTKCGRDYVAKQKKSATMS